MYLILCLHRGGKQLVKLLARKLIIVTDDMFGLIKSHFPNARIEFVHCPLFSLVLFCRPTHHEKNPKEGWGTSVVFRKSFFILSGGGWGSWVSRCIRPLDLFKLEEWCGFGCFCLPRLWWEISRPNFSLMNLGPENSWHKSDNLLVNITKLWPLHLPRSVLFTF